jgi:glycosyltransferase involved in cell wall biosynthesis
MKYMLEAVILMVLSMYFTYGATQLMTARRIKRKAHQMRFAKKDTFVSVIIPIRNIIRTTVENLSSTCTQNYPNYEVIFVAEVAEHAAVSPAYALSKKYPHVSVIFSGKHDPSKNIAKCHNLVYAVKHAKGDVFLFGDSDVTYSGDWVLKMTQPLNEIVSGRRIDATTASFFMDTASGASIAVSRKVFEELKISKLWETSFNDDLVFANKIVSSGYNLYNQHTLINHPNEIFSDWEQTKNKLIRWTFTVYTFGNKSLKKTTPIMFVKNQQFQLSLILALSMYLSHDICQRVPVFSFL